MKALVIGAAGTIGRALADALSAKGHETICLTRVQLDLLAIPEKWPAEFDGTDVVYLCAAMTRFIDCEANPDAYRVNVDAIIEIAQKTSAKKVYISSEAVERALHTNYGMQKALAEIGLRAVCNPVIARLSKVDPWSMDSACEFLIGLAMAKPGIYRWHA
jgi:NADH dehydrogenase